MFLFLKPDRDGRSFHASCSMSPPDGDVSAIPLPMSGPVNIRMDPQWSLRNPLGVHHRFQEDLAEIMPSVLERTMLSTDRLSVIRDCCDGVSSLDGMVAEVGVFRGGSLLLMSASLPDKMVHGFDTFEGFLDGPSREDFCPGGSPDLSGLRDVEFSDVLESVGSRDNVRLHRGRFPGTSRWLSDDDRFCLVHFDADLHSVATDFLNVFHHRMVDGGVMIFDDYGFEFFPGVKTAVDTFMSGRNDVLIETTPTQCIIVVGQDDSQ